MMEAIAETVASGKRLSDSGTKQQSASGEEFAQVLTDFVSSQKNDEDVDLEVGDGEMLGRCQMSSNQAECREEVRVKLEVGWEQLEVENKHILGHDVALLKQESAEGFLPEQLKVESWKVKGGRGEALAVELSPDQVAAKPVTGVSIQLGILEQLEVGQGGTMAAELPADQVVLKPVIGENLQAAMPREWGTGSKKLEAGPEGALVGDSSADQVTTKPATGASIQSVILEQLEVGQGGKMAAELPADQVVLKPVIGANLQAAMPREWGTGSKKLEAGLEGALVGESSADQVTTKPATGASIQSVILEQLEVGQGGKMTGQVEVLGEGVAGEKSGSKQESGLDSLFFKGETTIQNFSDMLSREGGSFQRVADRVMTPILTEVQLHQSFKEGDGDIRVMLKPESLGEVIIRLSRQDGQLTGRILVETPLVKEVLEANFTQLRQRLAELDINLTDFRVDLHNEFSDRGQSRQGQARATAYNYFRKMKAEEMAFLPGMEEQMMLARRLDIMV